MANDQYIIEHYKRIALQFSDRPDSTIRDLKIREEEIEFVFFQIYQFIYQNDRMPVIADIGCGNGHMLSLIHEFFPEIKLFGLEFSPDLREIATARKIPHCQIIQGDMRKEIPFHGIDLVITERSVINLLSKRQQESAICNIMNCLSDNGLYLMIESFQEPLVNLNLMQQENNLDLYNPSKHNFFLREGLIKKLKRSVLREVESEFPPNQLSMHFVLTRVFHPLIRQKGEKMHNNRLIKFIEDSLIPAQGNYSPILFRVFKKLCLF